MHASLIVKATRLCNLRCTYCHDWRAGPDQTMSFETMARVIRAALADPDHDSVEFIWHGGETTVLPIAFYERAMAVQARFRRPGQYVRNTLQTNGTRLSDAWIRFLRDAEFAVGVSLDGPPEVHDRVRLTVQGQPTFTDVARGIRALESAGVPTGVLMVVDADALLYGPDRIFDCFVELGVRSFGFVAAKPTNQPDATPGTTTDHYTAPPEMTRFVAAIYDRWLRHGDPEIRIREVDAIRHRIVGDSSGTCTLAGNCISQYYLVEPSGEIAHCDLFLGDPTYTFGSIHDDTFETIRRSAAVQDLRAANDAALAVMAASCEHFEVCNGWCPHERYLSTRHNVEHDPRCCGLAPLIEHVALHHHREAAMARTVAVTLGGRG